MYVTLIAVWHAMIAASRALIWLPVCCLRSPFRFRFYIKFYIGVSIETWIKGSRDCTKLFDKLCHVDYLSTNWTYLWQNCLWIWTDYIVDLVVERRLLRWSWVWFQGQANNGLRKFSVAVMISDFLQLTRLLLYGT